MVGGCESEIYWFLGPELFTGGCDAYGLDDAQTGAAHDCEAGGDIVRACALRETYTWFDFMPSASLSQQ